MMRFYSFVVTLLVVVGLAPTCTRATTEDIGDLIEVMAEGISDERQEAREALIAMGAEAMPSLVAATRDTNARIRWEAVNAPGTMASGEPDWIIVAMLRWSNAPSPTITLIQAGAACGPCCIFPRRCSRERWFRGCERG